MRSSSRYLLVGLALSVSCASLRAEESDSWAPALAVDVLGAGTGGKNTRSIGNSLCAAVKALPADCISRANGKMAFGGRIGYFYNSDDWRFGPSLGYLRGGPTAGKIALTSKVAGTLALDDNNNVVRFLAEGAGKFALGEPWAISVGGGFGWADNFESIKCSESGALTGSCATLKKKPREGWATWELTPSILYQGLELGIRYVGFARGRYNPWHTFGGTLGYRF